MTNLAYSYADALYSLSVENNISKNVLNDLTLICDVLSENMDYVKLLDAPQVNFDKKKHLIDEAFSGSDTYTLNFMKILAKNKMFHIIFNCLKEFEKKYNADNKIEKAEVISAVPLSESVKEKLTAKLENMTGKHVITDYKIDKTIIGGMIVNMGMSQMDASVKSKLEEIKKQLFAL